MGNDHQKQRKTYLVRGWKTNSISPAHSSGVAFGREKRLHGAVCMTAWCGLHYH